DRGRWPPAAFCLGHAQGYLHEALFASILRTDFIDLERDVAVHRGRDREATVERAPERARAEAGVEVRARDDLSGRVPNSPAHRSFEEACRSGDAKGLRELRREGDPVAGLRIHEWATINPHLSCASG